MASKVSMTTSMQESSRWRRAAQVDGRQRDRHERRRVRGARRNDVRQLEGIRAC
jgi:hypothetical protein